MSFYRTRLFERSWMVFLTILLLTIISRLPQLFSPNLFLNGDEAVLGIMAQNLLTKGDFPLFFLGQTYGLSTLEVFLIAPFLFVFGSVDLAIKLPMLLLFSVGLYFQFLFVRKISTSKAAWLSVIFMLILPAWQIWSMQARGGYLSAFLLYNVLLSFWIGNKKKSWFIVTNFLLLLFLYLCQPMWLVALLPFAFRLTKSQKKQILLFGLAAVGISVAFSLLSTKAYWSGPRVDVNSISLGLQSALELLPAAFGGRYWLGTYNYNHSLIFGASILGIVVLFALSIIKFVASYKRNELWFFLIFMLAIFGQVILAGAGGSRYFLPLFEVLVIIVALNFYQAQKVEKYITLILMIVCIMLSVNIWNYKAFTYNQVYQDYEKSVQTLVEKLKATNISAVYSLDPLLQWQIMFYSEQQIIARWENSVDRVADIPLKVDSVYYKTSERTAFLGYLPFGAFTAYKEKKSNKLWTVDDLFFVYQNPEKETLEEWNFELNTRLNTQ